MRYFKRKWNETRGDEYSSWGFSMWLFETDINGLPIRQIEIYDNGRILKYDKNKPFDNFGQLGQHELDLKEFSDFEISKEEFNITWDNY